MRDALGCDGVNVLNCCEPAAWQTVFHLRDPRYDDDPLQLPGQPRQVEPTSWPRWRRSSAVAERARLVRRGPGRPRDRQPAAQASSTEMVSDILAGLDQAEGCRALLVRAEGQYFTGGVDVNAFQGLSQADAEQLTADLLAITHRIEAAVPDARVRAGALPHRRPGCRSPAT